MVMWKRKPIEAPVRKMNQIEDTVHTVRGWPKKH